MVEFTSGYESKEIGGKKFKLLDYTQARLLAKLVPMKGEEFQKHNAGYFSTVLGLHVAYVAEVLDYMEDKGIISCEGEYYFLTMDNIYKIEQSIVIHPINILARRIKELS